MFRNGLAIVIAAAFGAMALCGCGDEIKNNNGAAGGGGTGTGGSSGSGGGAGTTSDSACTGECCPAAAECYSDATLGKNSPGAECLATRDNDPDGIVQFRQTWIRATTPLGNTSPVVYNVLSKQSALNWPACNMDGLSGYLQAIEMDFTKDPPESRVGFTKWVDAADSATVATSGLQMIEGDVPHDMWDLPNSAMSPTTGWPAGLPAPMGRADTPWHFAPTKAIGLPADFNLATQRADLIAKLAPTGEYGMQGYTGVFYADRTTGKSHGYAPLAFVNVYALQAGAYITIPIREVETKGTVNDPQHPNCMGVYRADVLDPTSGCLTSSVVGDPDYYAWGCKDNSCPAGDGPFTTDAYFLITELEQVYSSVLQQTLCFSYPGTADQGATTDQIFGTQAGGCRVDSRWAPATSTGGTGLPKGDWCAATNSAATTDCHDAWHSHSFHTFAGFPIKPGTTAP